MCGIAGFVQHHGRVEQIARTLAESLGRRGPDGSWTMRRGDVSFVQTRLAVIDLSPDVVYPMANEDENVWLLFNGEIYDYGVLRRRLRGLGHRFRTACDAEVVVHAYEEWGTDCFRHLNGMFALAILDERTGELVLARDRYGVKPLVYTLGEPFAFSSDAISLIESGLAAGAIDMTAIEEFVHFHYVPPPSTGLAGLCSIEPGTALVRARGGERRTIHWATPTFGGDPDEDGVPSGLAELDAAIGEAVERQLVADVDVGVFLSSGIDSALLLSYATGAGRRPVAFTIGFSGFGDYDEAARAAKLALRLGVDHHVEQFNIGFVDALELVSHAFDSPLADASAIPTVLLARMARRRVTVALSGTGGDELFAGYYRHRAHRLRPITSRVPEALGSALSHVTLSRGASRRSSLQAAASYAARLASAGGSDFMQQYSELVAGSLSPAARAALRFPVDVEDVRRRVARRHSFSDGSFKRAQDKIQDFDLETYLPGDVLFKEDRASMYSSVEARVPFLDQAVVDVARRIPPSDRASLIIGKKPLRQLASKRLGGGQLTWQKRGFAVPLDELLKGPWKHAAQEWFDSLNSSLVDGRRVRAQLDGPHYDAAEVWALATLGAWEGRLAEVRAKCA